MQLLCLKMLLSLIYFVCFLVEVSGVALLVFSLSRDVWYRFGASFPLYGEIQGYGNLWEKCFRVVLQQQQEFNCEALHPANTPSKFLQGLCFCISRVANLCTYYENSVSYSTVFYRTIRYQCGHFYGIPELEDMRVRSMSMSRKKCREIFVKPTQIPCICSINSLPLSYPCLNNGSLMQYIVFSVRLVI